MTNKKMIYAVCTDGSGSAEEAIIKTHGRPTFKIEAYNKEGHSAHNVLIWLNPDTDMIISNSSGRGKSIEGVDFIKQLENLTMSMTSDIDIFNR